MNKAEKSLRWVVNQIPDFKPTTNEEKMLVAIKLYSEAGAEEIRRLETENAELKSSLTHVNEELKTRIRRAEKAVYIAARDEIEALYNVKTMDKREYAEQIEAYMFDLFCRADRELAEEGKDD